MYHHRLVHGLVLFLSSAGALAAEPVTGVIGLHAHVKPVLMPEVTTAVFGPQEHAQCMDGRLIFGSGATLRTTHLSGVTVKKLDIVELGLTGEADPIVIADNHLVRSGDELLYAVMGVTYTPILCPAQNPSCKPDWWEVFDEFPAKGRKTPGARSAIWVFRSSDCGESWSLASKIDAALLETKDGKGFCGVPRLWEEIACKDSKKKDIEDCPAEADQSITKKWAEVGGWDGHYLASDPETGRMVISTLCAFGTGLGKVSKRPAEGVADSAKLLEPSQKNDRAKHIFVVSDDGGDHWTSQVSLEQSVWRGPVMALNDDRWAFVNRKDGKVLLFADDPLNGSFAKKIEVAGFEGTTRPEPPPWELRTHHFVTARDLALNRVPIGSTIGPGGLKQPVFRPLVQVASYTWKDGQVLRYQIHNVDLDTEISKALSAPIRSDISGESVSEGSFIQGHRASLFYWLEERKDNKFRVRYQVYSQGKPLLTAGLFRSQKPGVVKDANGEHEFTGDGTDDSIDFQGDYVKGAHYLDDKGTEHFFLVWNENGKLAFAEVRAIGLNDSPLQ